MPCQGLAGIGLIRLGVARVGLARPGSGWLDLAWRGVKMYETMLGWMVDSGKARSDGGAHLVALPAVISALPCEI